MLSVVTGVWDELEIVHVLALIRRELESISSAIAGANAIADKEDPDVFMFRQCPLGRFVTVL